MNANLVPIEAAYFPRLYDAARAALFRAEQVDECQEWSNRAAAMASYARQAKDRTLLDIATRIQARAVRRCGELLQQVLPVSGRPAPGTPSRSSAARDAGLSKLQKDTALATAAIPADEFERIVEGNRPPPPYKLRAMGRNGGAGIAGPSVDKIAKRIRRFANFCEISNAPHFRGKVDAGDVNRILAWCADFFGTDGTMTPLRAKERG